MLRDGVEKIVGMEGLTLLHDTANGIYHRLGQGQDPPAAGQGQGRSGEGDEEAEADRHRTHPQRQHEDRVEGRHAPAQTARAGAPRDHEGDREPEYL